MVVGPAHPPRPPPPPPSPLRRAILGSVERMFAILTEHYAGKWPLWLSPRQVMLVPISGGWVGARVGGWVRGCVGGWVYVYAWVCVCVCVVVGGEGA